MAASADTVIAVEGLEMAFGKFVIQRDLDFRVRSGEVFIIMGDSGSGKSTLLRHMIGLQRPSKGVVRYGDTNFWELPEGERRRFSRRFGVLYQSGALWSSMTLAQNVALPLQEHTEQDPNIIDITVKIKLELVGLREHANKYPAQISGGMKKRAAFARAMALDPDVLFCDEPSAGLDPVTAAGLDRLLIQLKDVFGVTLVVVTHEMESAFAIADRIALMHDGRFLVTGTPEEVQASEHPVVRRFLDRVPEDEGEEGERYERLIKSWEEEAI